MGKAQSKRSVDITTDKKDDVIEEGTGKMGKIEDVDQLKPQVNGDTHHNEGDSNEKEKLGDTEATENEKDLSTEKESKPQTEGTGGGDTTTNGEAAASETGKTIENGNDETLNESTTNATENGENSSKKKKEKLKKKWSFRSISFGKKDKQKPPKKDEETENGEILEELKEKVEETTKSDETNSEEKIAETIVENNEKIEESKEQTPVMNGTESESDKVSPIAATNSSDIVPQNDTQTEVKVEQNIVKAVAPSVEPSIEALKTIAADSTKIEVKPEIKNDSNTTHTEDENKQIIQQEVVKENNEADSETTKNILPPPLPNTPPPSQVMVFALSDTKSSEQEQSISAPAEPETKIEESTTINSIPSVNPITENDNKEIKLETVESAISVEISPTDQNSSVEKIDTETNVIKVIEKEEFKASEIVDNKSETDIKKSFNEELTVEVKNQEVEVSESKIETVKEETKSKEINEKEQKPELAIQVDSTTVEVEKNTNIIEQSHPKEIESIQLNIPKSSENVENIEEIKSVQENKESSEDEVKKNVTENNILDSEISSKQINETISLIDTVTKEALTVVQSKTDFNEDSNSENINSNDKEVSITETNFTESNESSNASPLENNSVPKDPEISSITESKIPLELPPSPVDLNVEENINEEQKNNIKSAESELHKIENNDMTANQSEQNQNDLKLSSAENEILHQKLSTENQDISKSESLTPEKLDEIEEKLQQAVTESKVNNF